MDKKKLMLLINKPEGIKLDFKQKLELYIESGKKELAKDVCAIANTRGGRGYIIVGVEDKTKRIIGVKKEEEFTEEQLQQIISSRCEPPIPISLDNFQIDSKQISVITIYDGMQKPYQLRENGAFYIRRGSTTDTMRKQELIAAFEENMSLIMETCPIIKSHPQALDMELINKYFKTKGVTLNEENKELLLESASILYKDRDSGEYKVTLGGLLVFSEINSVYIPHNMIRIINRINKNYPEVSTVQGSLLTILKKSENIINEIFPKDYPKGAIFEGIKNAVLYRDYGDITKEIQLIINTNSTTIISPGNLIEEKSIGNSTNYSKRNMWIYEKLINLDEENKLIQGGTGFKKMKRAFKNYGKVNFVNSKYDNIFKVIYPGIKRRILINY